MFNITDPEGLIFIISGIAFLLVSIAVVNHMSKRPSDDEALPH